MKRRALLTAMVLCVVASVTLSLVGEPLLSFGAVLTGMVLFGIGLACARPSNWPTTEPEDHEGPP